LPSRPSPQNEKEQERYRSLSQVAWMIPGKSMVGTRLLRAQAKHGPR